MKHSEWKLSVFDKVSFSTIIFPYPVSSNLLIAFSFFQSFAFHLLDQISFIFQENLTSFKRKSEYTQPGNYLILLKISALSSLGHLCMNFPLTQLLLYFSLQRIKTI